MWRFPLLRTTTSSHQLLIHVAIYRQLAANFMAQKSKADRLVSERVYGGAHKSVVKTYGWSSGWSR